MLFRSPKTPLDGLEPGFWLTVARLLPYKNVDAIVAAFASMPTRGLVVAGDGPERERLASGAPRNVTFVGSVDDPRLRWLYEHCVGMVAASHEDFGLTPLEAAAFGKATVALRFGGYLDTIVDGQTGVLVDGPDSAGLADGVRRLEADYPDANLLAAHAARFHGDAFAEKMRAVVTEEWIRSARRSQQ